MIKFKLFKAVTALLSLVVGTQVFATKTTSTASFTVTGVVPEVYRLSTQSLTRDLDLKPGVSVSREPIGKLRFSYNADLEGITIASSTASGNPEDDSNNTLKFARPFTISILGKCRSLDTRSLKPGVTLVSVGADYKSLNVSNLTDGQTTAASGVDEECQLMASWKTEKLSKTLMRSKKGVYSMNVIITMVAL